MNIRIYMAMPTNSMKRHCVRTFQIREKWAPFSQFVVYVSGHLTIGQQVYYHECYPVLMSSHVGDNYKHRLPKYFLINWFTSIILLSCLGQPLLLSTSETDSHLYYYFVCDNEIFEGTSDFQDKLGKKARGCYFFFPLICYVRVYYNKILRKGKKTWST